MADSNLKSTKKSSENQVVVDFSKSKPDVFSYIGLGLGLGWFFTIPFVIFITPMVYDNFPFVIYFFVTLVFLSTFYPVDYKFQPSWCYAIGEWMIMKSMKYFYFKLECEDHNALETLNSPCIFAMEPHGVLPITLFWGKTKAIKSKEFKYRCCLSSSMFVFPMMKHFLTWCGAISVDKKEMIKYLDRGFSLGLCPGGVKEVQYLGDRSECVLYLKDHKGFTKLAMSRGIPVVPTFTFGLRDTYSIWKPPLPEWIKSLSSKMGFFPMVFFGLWGIPFAQAKPVPLNLIVGKPIVMPKWNFDAAEGDEEKKKEDQEMLEKQHNIVVSEICRLFEENKHKYGDGDVTLRVV